MKVYDIAKKYNINAMDFEIYVRRKNFLREEKIFGMEIDDSLVESYVEIFKKDMKLTEEDLAIKAQMEAQEKAEQELEAARKKKAMAEMLITSGFNFDGYRITKYSGYISGDDAISVDRGLAIFSSGGTNVKNELMNSLVTIRRNALRELKEAAYALGCNAVIGVDFDYLTLDPQTANLTGGTTYQPYVFGVTANGNAVVIEKIGTNSMLEDIESSLPTI